MLVGGPFNALAMAGSALAERTGAAHQHPAAVPQFAVEGLNHAHTDLADAVSRGRQHLRASMSDVGKVGVALVIGQRITVRQ